MSTLKPKLKRRNTIIMDHILKMATGIDLGSNDNDDESNAISLNWKNERSDFTRDYKSSIHDLQKYCQFNAMNIVETLRK